MRVYCRRLDRLEGQLGSSPLPELRHTAVLTIFEPGFGRLLASRTPFAVVELLRWNEGGHFRYRSLVSIVTKQASANSSRSDTPHKTTSRTLPVPPSLFIYYAYCIILSLKLQYVGIRLVVSILCI